MDMLIRLPMPACIINRLGEVLITNSAFSELAPGKSFIKNISTHFRSDIYPDRAFSLDRYAHSGEGIETLIHATEYVAYLYAHDTPNSPGYLAVFFRKPPTKAIDPAMQEQMLKYSVDCIKLIRTDGTLEYMNRASCLALGVPVTESEFGMRWLDLLPEDVRRAGEAKLQAAIHGATASFPGRSVDQDGVVIYWDNLLTPVNDPRTNERKVICVSRNVTQEVIAKARLKELSEIDELTRIHNRRHFNEALERYVRDATPQRPALLFLVDLDHFKAVNDSLGYHAGDHVLRSVAERWRRAIPPDATLARLGGDEFAVVYAPDAANDLAQAGRLGAAIADAALAPVAFEGSEIHFGLSIGCVSIPLHAGSTHDAMVLADRALRLAKSTGKGRCSIHANPVAEHALAHTAT